jgi:hypothetical protein
MPRRSPHDYAIPDPFSDLLDELDIEPVVTIKAAVDLPARLFGGNAQKVEVDALDYTLHLDLSKLPVSAAPTANAKKWTVVWDEVANLYKRVEFTSLPGTVGPAGPTGATGATGPTGPAGVQGAPGVAGTPGAQGAAGPTGPLGPTGAPGPQGVPGPTGPAGPQGLTGPAGSTGATGAKGDKGDKGDTGPAGSGGGADILDGEGPPADTLGVAGQYYVDIVGQDLYGPKAAGPQYIVPSTSAPTTTQGGDYRLANVYKFLVAGQITGARFWRNAASVVTGRRLYLYDDTTQALLATSNLTVESGSQVGWVEAAFPTPINVVANQQVAIAYDTNDQNSYGTTTAAVADPTAIQAVMAKWHAPSGQPLYPIVGSGAFSFFTDLLWVPTGAGGEVWPVAVSSGTEILNGNGPPDVDLGTDGQYYVDSLNHDLYGPKSGDGYGASEYALASTAPPSISSGSWRLGNTLNLLVAGQVTGARFYRMATSSSTSRRMYLFNAAQVLIATSDLSIEVAGVAGWIDVAFPAPIVVAAGQYTICYEEPGGNYGYDSAPVPQNATHATHVAGVWGVIGAGFPTAGSNTNSWTADIKWRVTTGIVWPLAVSSGGDATISTSPPSGGSPGDVWYQVT